MRIAYICPDRGIPLGGVKGASVHLRSLAGALARRGHDVVLGCVRVDGPNPVPPGVRPVELPEHAPDGWYREMFEKLRTEAVLERYALGGGAALKAASDL